MSNPMESLTRTGSDWTRLIAVVATIVSALGLLGVAVGSVAVRAQLFSVGIASVLTIYGLLVVATAWVAWRRPGWGNGLLVATNALHVLVAVSFATAGQAWWWAISMVPILGVGGSLMSYTAHARRSGEETRSAQVREGPV